MRVESGPQMEGFISVEIPSEPGKRYLAVFTDIETA